MSNKKLYWWKSIVSMGVILGSMPMVHLVARVLKDNYDGTQLLGAGMAVGFVGLVMVVVGVFVKGQTRQTLLGLIGGMFYWTGWVDFLFMYYAHRWGTHAEIDPVTGEVLSRPEYLLLPATFGLWAMVMLLYIFCSRNACNFLNWWQTLFLGKNKRLIAARPMTRHTSIVTFMEVNMMLWGCYLLLMFCYDKNFLGDHHPVTFLIGLGCLVGSIFMFKRQLYLASWGANIRMAIATVIVFWTPVEILGRINFFKEFWTEPQHYVFELSSILVVFIALLLYLWMKGAKKKKG